MDDQFQNTRFAIFCKLMGSAGTTADFEQQVAEEAAFQKELGSFSAAEKEVSSLYSGVTKMVVGKEIVRYVLKVYVNEHQYKSITCSNRTTAKQVCALGAKKFGLPGFSFALVLRSGSEYRPLADDALPSDEVEACVGAGATDIQFFFVAPRCNPDNWAMRERAIIRYLNHYLGMHITPVKDLGKDMSSGVVLCKYVEYLLGKKNVAPHPSPSKSERAENVRAAFAALTEAGINLPGNPVNEVTQGDAKTIVSLIWNIFFRFCTVNNTLNWADSLNRYASDPNEFVFLEAVMYWCKSLASNYSVVNIQNYASSWSDGMAMAAMMEMTDNYVCSAHRFQQMQSPQERLSTAIEMAHGIYNVPPLITAEDFENIDEIDEWTVCLYVTILATQLNKKRQQRFARQTLVNLSKGDDATAPTTYNGEQLIKIFFEGNPDFDFKMFKLTIPMSVDELRQTVANKLHTDPNGFWIFLQENQVERNVGAGEIIFTHPQYQVVTVKFVAGSHYYTGEYTKPIVQGAAAGSAGKKKSEPTATDRSLKVKKKSWRSSLSFGKKR